MTIINMAFYTFVHKEQVRDINNITYNFKNTSCHQRTHKNRSDLLLKLI